MLDTAGVRTGELVAELWRRVQARDWDGVRGLLADDFVLEWPSEKVGIRGPEKFVEFNRSYPEGWSIEMLRIVDAGETAASEVRVPHPTVGLWYALSFFDARDGRLARVREYWVEEHDEELSSERAQWFERL